MRSTARWVLPVLVGPRTAVAVRRADMRGDRGAGPDMSALHPEVKAEFCRTDAREGRYKDEQTPPESLTHCRFRLCSTPCARFPAKPALTDTPSSERSA